MPTQYNFREIWNKKNTDIPSIEEVKTKAENYRKRQILKDVGMMVMMFLSAITIIIVWISARFSFFTTKLGIMLLLTGVLSFIYLIYQKVNILKKVKTTTTNQEYLLTMKKAEQQQIYIQTRGLSFYYILLSLGFAFYFYEFALKMSSAGILLLYGLTFSWGLFNWFIVRPRRIRKQREKMSAVMHSLERLEKSFED